MASQKPRIVNRRQAGPTTIVSPAGPDVRREFDDPTKMNIPATLAQKLIPVADNIRNLNTRFGVRNYKLRVVRVRWSGGRRGIGVPNVESAIDILPTPLVQDLSTLTEILNPIGLDEVGIVGVGEISGRFNDDQLRYGHEDGLPPEPDEEVFYEIEYPQPDAQDSIKRRFVLRGAPHYNAGQFQWRIRLEKANEDRARNGDPR